MGWESAAAARASRVNRARAEASAARLGASTFTATRRFSAISRSRKTAPMPPTPISRRNWYSPSSDLLRSAATWSVSIATGARGSEPCVGVGTSDAPQVGHTSTLSGT